MFQIDVLDLIPQTLRRQAVDAAAVDFVSDKADDAIKLAERASEIYGRLGSHHRIEETAELLEALSQSPYDPSVYPAWQG